MLNILVVEDEAPIREWIVYTISKLSEDFNILGSGSNGKEGLELFEKLRPQVILTDIKMPQMDGIELVKEVKNIDKSTYVVILTNYAEFEYAKQAISYGVYEYLIKSDIRPKELKELLNNIYEEIKANNKVKIENKIDDSIFANDREKVLNDNLKCSEEKEVKYSKAITRALKYIENNYKEHISLGDISGYVYLSNEYFSRLFKEEVGENFTTYINIYRIRKAEYLLKNTDKRISEIGNEVGFINAGYFSKTYKKYRGVSPEDDRY